MAKGLETSESIKLPPELRSKLIDIENQFNVSSEKLKQIYPTIRKRVLKKKDLIL